MIKRDKAELIRAIERGASWIINIAQVRDKSDPMFGAIRNCYNTKTKEWRFYEPFWHTGQAVRALVAAYKITKRKEFLDGAFLGASYMESLQFNDPNDRELYGLIRAHDKPDMNTCGMSTMTDGFEGLFDLYEETGDKRWLNIVRKAADWIIEHTWIEAEGLIYDYYDFKKREIVKTGLPGVPGGSLNLYVRPNNEGATFGYLYKLTGEEKYKTVFKKLSDRLAKDQNYAGVWPDYTPNNKLGSMHVRFNIWYAMSLIYASNLLNDHIYLDAARKTGEWYVKIQDLNGAIYYTRLDGKHGSYAVSGSASAFAGLLWLELYKKIPDPRYLEAINLSLDFLLYTQYSDDFEDPNLRGAYFESWGMIEHSGFSYYTFRDLATVFAVQFISAIIKFNEISRVFRAAS